MNSNMSLPFDKGGPGILLDTDLGNDVDDVLALAMLLEVANAGRCRLLATLVNKSSPLAPLGCEQMHRLYYRDDIPIGWVGPDGPTPDAGTFLPAMLGDVAAEKQAGIFPDAVKVARKALAEQEDNSVVVVSIGFLTNLCRLLRSAPDEISPLDGMNLVRSKVRVLSLVAGNFSKEALKIPHERFKAYNVLHDVPSAKYVVDNWPTPAVFCGWEFGNRVCYPATNIETSFDSENPIRKAYSNFAPMPHNRPCWDLISAWLAFTPGQSLLDLIGPGVVTIFPEGHNSFQHDPAGKHYYLDASEDSALVLRDEFVNIISRKHSCYTSAIQC